MDVPDLDGLLVAPSMPVERLDQAKLKPEQFSGVGLLMSAIGLLRRHTAKDVTLPPQTAPQMGRSLIKSQARCSALTRECDMSRVGSFWTLPTSRHTQALPVLPESGPHLT